MLIHYTIVRRDLPLGVVCAMLVHAAGESAAIYEAQHLEGFLGCVAVVLEAKNEASLTEYAEYLNKHGIKFVAVHEPSGTYAGQFMAIGIVPFDRELIAPLMIDCQCLKRLEPQEPCSGE